MINQGIRPVRVCPANSTPCIRPSVSALECALLNVLLQQVAPAPEAAIDQLTDRISNIQIVQPHTARGNRSGGTGGELRDGLSPNSLNSEGTVVKCGSGGAAQQQDVYEGSTGAGAQQSLQQLFVPAVSAAVASLPPAATAVLHVLEAGHSHWQQLPHHHAGQTQQAWLELRQHATPGLQVGNLASRDPRLAGGPAQTLDSSSSLSWPAPPVSLHLGMASPSSSGSGFAQPPSHQQDVVSHPMYGSHD